MNAKTAEYIENWIKARTQRERAYVLAGVLFMCTFIWYILWESTYQDIQKSQQTQRHFLQDKIISFKTQNKILRTMIGSVELAKKRADLQKQLQDVNIQLNAVSTQLVSSTVMTQALKNILVQTPNLRLIHLSNSESIPLTSKNSDINKSSAFKLYQHDFILEFEGDYFSVLEYLKNIENSSFRFYGDNITYNVTQYPKARITLKIHTVSKEKDFIDE